MDAQQISAAFGTAIVEAGGDPTIAGDVGDTILRAAASTAEELPPGTLVIRALSLFPEDAFARVDEFSQRTAMAFEVRTDRPEGELVYADGEDAGRFRLAPHDVLLAVQQANASLIALHQFTSTLRVPISELLGMRNLSSLVSSVMVSELQAVLNADVYINPHQDGYPDLIPRTASSSLYYEAMREAGRLSDKTAWTNPGFGGIEVKATCGNTPAASKVAKRGLGETRADIIVGFDWKAHHRETKRLLAAIWDFVDGVPTVTAAFYRNDLIEEDWGKIVSPKEGGGRTTSVSIMSRNGISKMADGWMVRTTDAVLRSALEKGRMIATADDATAAAAGRLDGLLEDLEHARSHADEVGA